MKLLAVLVIAIALSGSAVARTPRFVPRSELRDAAASQRKFASTSCERDSPGRIRRSSAARREFQREHPCPSTGSTAGPCPGYVLDHVVPLKRGGADDPSNMQWQGMAEAKVKTNRVTPSTPEVSRNANRLGATAQTLILADIPPEMRFLYWAGLV
jgi:hypothetical protein